MRLLLDSHVLLWWLFGVELGQSTREAIESTSDATLVSVASIWEVEIKRASGRLTAPDDLVNSINRTGSEILPISPAHAVAAARLPRLHGDPFDRMLIAQAKIEGLTLVTRDERLGIYGVSMLPA